jgi:hypothetical protein
MCNAEIHTKTKCLTPEVKGAALLRRPTTGGSDLEQELGL